MGKKSREKRDRDAQPAPVGLHHGVTFQVGIEPGHSLPIMLHFAVNGRTIFPSRWSAADARNIALALLKYVEVYGRYQQADQLTTAPETALPLNPAPAGGTDRI